ncbi:MAG: glycosyl hydrolase [Clostridia bacterium]|nr:glycosyl hydrolase [Clostridia bacterium]
MTHESRFSMAAFQNADTPFQPAYAWIWNDQIESAELRRRLDGLRRAGIRTVYVLPEPKNFRPERIRTFLEPDYLTDEFMRLVREAAEYALSIGMNVWMYDEGGWPSGGACGRTVEKHPRMIRKALNPREETLPAETAYAPKADDAAAFTAENGALRRVKPGERFPEARTLTVYGVRLGEGWTTDSLQDGIGEAFVEETHERYAKFLGDLFPRVPFMFTDEPGTGRFPWPDGFAEKFLSRFGYDLRDHLPALFNLREDASGMDARAREDYRALQGELFRKNYMKPIHDWCRKNGVRFTGHLDIDHMTDGCMAHGYGTVLQQLREFDVPGVDVIWRQIDLPKDGKSACYEGNGFFERFASSAAAQTGGTLAVTESFGVYGASLTGRLARFVILHQLARGINVFNFMCLSYTPKNALALVERPEYVEEMPGFFHLRGLNDFTARASWLMQLGAPAARAALYFPARDIWAGGTRAKNAIDGFERLGQALERAQVDFDILDEEGLGMAVRDGNALTLGLARYETVLVPRGATLPDALREKLRGVDAPVKPVVYCSCIGDELALRDAGAAAKPAANDDGSRACERLNGNVAANPVPCTRERLNGDALREADAAVKPVANSVHLRELPGGDALAPGAAVKPGANGDCPCAREQLGGNALRETDAAANCVSRSELPDGDALLDAASELGVHGGCPTLRARARALAGGEARACVQRKRSGCARERALPAGGRSCAARPRDRTGVPRGGRRSYLRARREQILPVYRKRAFRSGNRAEYRPVAKGNRFVHLGGCARNPHRRKRRNGSRRRRHASRRRARQLGASRRNGLLRRMRLPRPRDAAR